MKTKDYLIVALLPLALLLVPLTGQLTVDGWHWTWHDFLFAWVVFSVTTFVFRLIVSRKFANLAYKAGAEGWLSAAWRRTFWPAVATLACVVALGAAIDHWVPEARSLPHAVRLLRV